MKTPNLHRPISKHTKITFQSWRAGMKTQNTRRPTSSTWKIWSGSTIGSKVSPRAIWRRERRTIRAKVVIIKMSPPLMDLLIKTNRATQITSNALQFVDRMYKSKIAILIMKLISGTTSRMITSLIWVNRTWICLTFRSMILSVWIVSTHPWISPNFSVRLTSNITRAKWWVRVETNSGLV